MRNWSTALRKIRIGLHETFMGARRAERCATPDADLAPSRRDPHVNALRAHGWRSMVVLPLRREDEIIGALVVRRTVPGACRDGVVDLLETLASQSVVAIQNARVFQELEHKTRELEVASQHKSEFLASMSHELRTPLNAVIGFSDVLLDRMFGELNERQDEYVRDIRDSGRHLLELINEILDLSKVEAGQMELDLDAGLAGGRDRARRRDGSRARRAAPNRARVRRRAEPRRGLGRRAQAQAGGPEPAQQRGEVHARRRVGDGRRPGGSATRRRSSVRDTGIGIAEDQSGPHLRGVPAGRSRARGRARRAPGSASRCRSGSSISTAAACGWRASSASEAPSRSRSRSLPGAARARRATSARGGARGRAAAFSSSRTTAARRTLLRVYLEDAGYAVAIARDGVEALDLVRRSRRRP